MAAEREREAQAAARLDSASLLAGTVAHDLNNILTVILGFGTLLAERVASDPDASASVREVLAAGDRAARLTQRLLAFSGRQALSPSRVDVADAVNDWRQTLQEVLGTQVSLEVRVSEGLPAARIDIARFHDALTRLAENARTAMPEGGRLTIRIDGVVLDDAGAALHLGAPAGSYVRVSVTDTGGGMPREVQERIFEPFVTTKPKGEVAGFGLATTYGFVRQSGGFMSVTSRPRLGTTVTLHLPVFDAAPPEQARPEARPRRLGSGETVLVVDDTEAIRSWTAEALRRAGYRVVVAATASEALYMAGVQRGPIHLLLTDVVMPGGSGVDLATELRNDRRGLRVIYMSGVTDAALGRGVALGAGETFLAKPFTPAALLQAVGSLLT